MPIEEKIKTLRSQGFGDNAAEQKSGMTVQQLRFQKPPGTSHSQFFYP